MHMWQICRISGEFLSKQDALQFTLQLESSLLITLKSGCIVEQ